MERRGEIAGTVVAARRHLHARMFACVVCRRDAEGRTVVQGRACADMPSKEAVLGELDLAVGTQHAWLYARDGTHTRPIDRLLAHGFSGWDAASGVSFRLLDCRHTRRPCFAGESRGRARAPRGANAAS